MKDTTLVGVRLITPTFIHEDHRGRNLETFNKRLFNLIGPNIAFVQDSVSISRRGVLRGLHGDAGTWKLLSCLSGSVYVVVVNNISGHEQFRKWEGFVLSDRNRRQLLVPPMFGNGHQVLTDEAIFSYKLSEYTDTAKQFSIRWNAPELGIFWPFADPILSARDGGAE